MKGKTIGEKISVFFSFVIVGLLLYVGTAWGINMLVGPTFHAGEGLTRRGSGGGIDSVHVLPDYTMRINHDSAGVDTTHFWLLADVHYADWGDIHDTSAVLWGAITDSAEAVRGEINDSIYANTAGFATNSEIHDSLNANWSTWLDGDASEADIHDSLNANWAAFTSGSDVHIHDSLWANTPGYSTNSEIHDSLNANWSTWLDGDASEADVHDSIVANGQGFATNSEIGDSIWKSKPCQYYASPAIFETMADSIGVYWWLANGSWDKFLRNYNLSGAADDQIDTIVFSLIMPVESPDIDSLAFDLRTCANDADSAGLVVVMFKRTTPLADTVRIYTGSGIATDSDLSHQAIAGGDIDAISGGDKLVIWMIGTMDVGDSVEYNEPIPWAPQT